MSDQLEPEPGTAMVRAPRETGLSPFAFEPQSFAEAVKVAELLSRASLLPEHLRGKTADVVLVMMKGRELGLSFMQAVSSMHVIEGKVALAAELMVGLVQRRRDVCKYFRLVESSELCARYETWRVGEPEPVRMAFTIEQAKAAGLLDKGATEEKRARNNWRRFPEPMLRARAAAALARAVYPDLVLGLHTPDELEDSEPPREVNPAYVAPPPAAQVFDAEHSTVDGQLVRSAVTEAGFIADPSGERVDDVRSRIQSAMDEAALQALVPVIQALPKPLQEELKPFYVQRRRQLRERPMRGERAPGADDE